MTLSQDLNTLQQAGIDDPNLLIQAAATFLRNHPIQGIGTANNALSASEVVLLKQHGAKGLDDKNDRSDAEVWNVATIAGEYAQMLNTSLDQKETTKKLGVSASRIRQRLDPSVSFVAACSLQPRSKV